MNSICVLCSLVFVKGIERLWTKSKVCLVVTELASLFRISNSVLLYLVVCPCVFVGGFVFVLITRGPSYDPHYFRFARRLKVVEFIE